MRRKDKLDIVGFSVPIVTVDASAIDGDHAEYVSISANPAGPLIRISRQSPKEQYHLNLWHEGLHSILDLTGISALLNDERIEEAVVTALEIHGLQLAQQCLQLKKG